MSACSTGSPVEEVDGSWAYLQHPHDVERETDSYEGGGSASHRVRAGEAREGRMVEGGGGTSECTARGGRGEEERG